MKYSKPQRCYRFECPLCGDSFTSYERRQKDAEADARSQGYSKTKQCGWVCPVCAGRRAQARKATR